MTLINRQQEFRSRNDLFDWIEEKNAVVKMRLDSVEHFCMSLN